MALTKRLTKGSPLTYIELDGNFDYLNNIATGNTQALTGKVDSVNGKQLSTEDFTTANKNLLAQQTGANTGDQDLSNLVVKVTGMGLSTNDYTTVEKTKLAQQTGTNTGDQDLSGKVDKVTGFGLSSNDYTTAEKTKLATLTNTTGSTGSGSLPSGSTILSGGNTGDQSQPLFYWKAKLRNAQQYSTLSTLKIAFNGDSTSDQTGNASGLVPYLTLNYAQSGDILAGLVAANFPNFGSNGNTLANYLNNSPTGFGIQSVISAAPDLIVFSYGINDTRQNLVTKDQLKTMIISAINQLRAGIPNVSIVLRMPNSFLSVSPNGYIVQGSYPDIATAAQAQSDILYYAYKELENYWDNNVILVDTQTLLFGRVVQASSTLHTDEIHPQYGGIIDLIAPLIGFKSAFRLDRAKEALALNYQAPWTTYARSLEMSSNFILIGTGRYAGQGSTYIDFGCDAYDIAGRAMAGDIINIGDQLIFALPPASVFGSQTAANMRLTVPSVPTNTVTGGQVSIYRSKFNFNIDAENYFKNIGLYPYRRRCVVVTAGVGYIRLGTVLNDDILTPKTSQLSAGRYVLSTTDILVPNGGLASLPLTGFSFSTLNSTTLQMLKSGVDYTAYAGAIVYIFGNHAYEDPIPVKNAINIGPFNSILSVTPGSLGMNGTTGGLKILEPVGNKLLQGTIYSDSSVPTGNTITNTTTKTYFASTINIPIGGFISGQVLTFSGYGTITTDATTPGTIIFGLDSIQTVATTLKSLVTSAAVALPVGLTNAQFKYSIDVFITTSALNGILEVQGEVSIINGITIPLVNTAKVTPVNTNVALDFKLAATFSSALSTNSITLRTMKVISN